MVSLGPFSQPEIKRIDWIRAGFEALVGGDLIKLQVKVNSQQQSLVTEAPCKDLDISSLIE